MFWLVHLWVRMESAASLRLHVVFCSSKLSPAALAPTARPAFRLIRMYVYG
uniref:Uncharacterized protein n=1 Tax=Arundo donax TaxID=35708 RepID=A0A0A8ZP08_ARUDO